MVYRNWLAAPDPESELEAGDVGPSEPTADPGDDSDEEVDDEFGEASAIEEDFLEDEGDWDDNDSSTTADTDDDDDAEDDWESDPS